MMLFLFNVQLRNKYDDNDDDDDDDVSLWLSVYVSVSLCLVEGEVCEVEQTFGSLAMEAVAILLTGNNSNAGRYKSLTNTIFSACCSHISVLQATGNGRLQY